jgi:hypothetical protein
VADVLNIWTVYKHPRDYPDQYVARRFEVGGAPTDVRLLHAAAPSPTNDMFVADTLREVRALLPPGLFRMPRQESDDPVIVEVWL